MATTLKEVADAAGVSPAAVSLVLNGRPGVGSKTRERVTELAALLGYEQRRSRAKEVVHSRGIRFLRIAKHGHIINPNHRVFIADYIDGLEREAKLHGYRLEIQTIEGFEPAEILASLTSGSLEGAVVLGTELDAADLALFRDTPVPVVCIDTCHPHLRCDFVDMDNDSSVYAVVEYLYGQGHRRLGLVKSRIETRNFLARERAFIECTSSFGLELRADDVFAIDSTFEQGLVEMGGLLSDQRKLPTALFCVNDIIAYASAQALRGLGRQIPDDVSLVGFDDLPSNIYMQPRLSSISVSKQCIGRRAVQCLLDRIKEPTRPFEKVLIGGELVIRDSVRRIT